MAFSLLMGGLQRRQHLQHLVDRPVKVLLLPTEGIVGRERMLTLICLFLTDDRGAKAPDGLKYGKAAAVSVSPQFTRYYGGDNV